MHQTVHQTVQYSLKLCAISLSLLLWSTEVSKAIAQPLPNPPVLHSTQMQQLGDLLSRVRVVYLGEQHDRQADHQAQLAVIQMLHQRSLSVNSLLHSSPDRSPPVNQTRGWAIALEMFQRPYQPYLDQYVAGQITEAELRQKSEYDQRWGFPWEYYAPILRYAREHQIPLVALNTPTEVTRKVARGGFTSLTVEERRWIPPVAEIRTDNAAYRQRMQQIYDQIHHGQGNSDRFENFFLAQVLWDETMAAAIAEYVQAHPTRQLVVLAGQGHLVYGDGIPSRVERRLGSDATMQVPFSQRIILLNPSPEIQQQDRDVPIADYFWRSE